MLNKLFTTIAVASCLSACTDSQENATLAQANKPLEIAILDCEDITEKAAKHLVAVVEFQKLEIAGRKAHVFKQCMHDRSYMDNPEWLVFSQPVANKIAHESQVSVDEALENLRRLNMMTAYGEAKRPPYWIRQK